MLNNKDEKPFGCGMEDDNIRELMFKIHSTLALLMCDACILNVLSSITYNHISKVMLCEDSAHAYEDYMKTVSILIKEETKT